ncbi:hypothetical protein FPANT_9362 [Fusarium pseudoanthophilum]|uniref:Uncharacterized protein n=1 Tax=Fusarium pseudoanthophilum TaxID=48495 RepID=A0A8H5KX95_9HYPO|nr:hypothetical protein FPANT_9362 [Fusarium pseudoanthophilum]
MSTEIENPPAREPFLSSSVCGWDLTEDGQSEVMQAMLGHIHPFDGWTALQCQLGSLVKEICLDRGDSPHHHLYEEPIFDYFPLLEYGPKTKYIRDSPVDDPTEPLLRLTALLITSPPCKHMPCAQTKRHYMAVKAMFAFMDAQLLNHVPLVQIQGLIALYEYINGMLDKAHLTISSAVSMASRIEINISQIPLDLEWRFCLMIIDSFISLQTVHRKQGWIPLACPPGHALEKAVTHYLPSLTTPQGTPRFDRNCPRVLNFGKQALHCGRILQNLHDSKRSQRINQQECDFINKEYSKCLNHCPTEFEGYPSLQTSACLAASCLFAHHTEMERLDPFHHQYVLDPGQESLFQEYRKSTWRSMEKQFKIVIVDDYVVEGWEVDDTFLGFPEAICLLHDFLLMTRKPDILADFTTKDQIAAFIPVIRERTENWPAVRAYINQICNEVGLSQLAISECNRNGSYLSSGHFYLFKRDRGEEYES